MAAAPRGDDARRADAEATAASDGGRRWAPARHHAFPIAVGAICVLALVLRLWGHRTGLPFVYNVDEGAHFVPRAIGMFDHSYDPRYFINPPGLTYVLHVAFWLRWGGTRVQELLATDPTAVWSFARVIVALLSTLSVAALAWAGARLLGRRVALAAALLLAVAFLPVFYGRFALNDAPTLLPVAICIGAIAGIYTRGARVDYAVAGLALGAAIAFKYTAGIWLLGIFVAAWFGPRPRGEAIRLLLLAGALTVVAFLVLNPYALLQTDEFRAGLREQRETSAEVGSKLGLPAQRGGGVRYYLDTLTWGLGWIPLLLAVGGGLVLLRRKTRLALILLVPVLAFALYMGIQGRFFARWLLPVYPAIVLLAAWGAVHGAQWVATRVGRPRRALLPVGIAALLLAVQGGVYSVHNAVALSRTDTRAALREWMVDNIPVGSKIVIEPFVPDPFVTDVGSVSPTRTGERWFKRGWSHFRITPSGKKQLLRDQRLEDYVPSLRPDLLGSYTRGGYCWVIKGSTQYGRAYVTPDRVPYAIDYYRELDEIGTVEYETSPLEPGADEPPFSFDDSYNARPLGYERMGPRIVVYRLRGDDCR